MASRPPQPSLPLRQRSLPHRATSPLRSEASSSQQRRRSSLPQSTCSEDSQTVLLNHPSSSESSPKPKSERRRASPRPNLQIAQSNKDPRKCWICFSDETEDRPTSSRWRSPCPCALTAHEGCLLDWVADLESPKNQGKGPPGIFCPQCKSEIIVNRPKSLIVNVVQAFERATGRLILPFVLVTLAGTVITGCWMHGYSSVYLILGPEDAETLMGMNRTIGIDSNWGLALPFIPLALVTSRGTFGDGIFPVLPLLYFTFYPPQRKGSLWPPSVAMTIATLPYLRAAYNEVYSRTLAPREKAWTKDIQPRAGESGTEDDQGRNNEDAEMEVPRGLDFELDVQVEIVEEEEIVERGREQGGQREVPRVQDLPEHNPAQGQPEQGLPEAPALQHHEHDHIPGAAAIPGAGILLRPKQSAQSVIAALLFPTVAAAMGVLLKVVLPQNWTTPPRYWDRHTPGFLSSRFGRSIAGGCLFVVLRDTVSLYSKYRLAQNHKQRRILNYPGQSKGRRAENDTP